MNPGGDIGTGAIIFKGQDEQSVIYENSGFFPASEFEYMATSNNVAEYMALIDVMNYMVVNSLSDRPILIRGDSKLVIKQMSGWWKAKGGRYEKYHDLAKKLLKNFKDVQFKWIPREENIYADELSKQGVYARTSRY